MSLGALLARAVRLQHDRGDDEYDARGLRADLRLPFVTIRADRELRVARSGLHRARIARIDRPYALDVENPRLRGLSRGGEAGDENEESEELAKHRALQIATAPRNVQSPVRIYAPLWPRYTPPRWT